MKKFIDETYLKVKAGNGGDGIISFERYKYQPIGKPGGGDGGHGGSIIIKVDSNLSDLSHLTQINLVKAMRGGNGGAFKKTGKDGKDEYIFVPAGVIIREFETKAVLKELMRHDEEFTVAQGGLGGQGNTHFKSSTNRSPRQATPGHPGEELTIIIELKLLADVGLVGFPNAGKSTLLKAMTEARPEIADYPFTTLSPNLGIFYDKGHRPYRLADLPGLIEDSHKGKGLGTQFLKHIERTRILCLMVDISEKEHEKKAKTLLKELREYDPGLVKKKIVYTGNKADLLPGTDSKPPLKKYILISALNKTNLERLKEEFIRLIRKP
ncbi:MAG: GTPase ObgE [bacterium]|nr:GTPase ObgE [bacterium]